MIKRYKRKTEKNKWRKTKEVTKAIQPLMKFTTFKTSLPPEAPQPLKTLPVTIRAWTHRIKGIIKNNSKIANSLSIFYHLLINHHFLQSFRSIMPWKIISVDFPELKTIPLLVDQLNRKKINLCTSSAKIYSVTPLLSTEKTSNSSY